MFFVWWSAGELHPRPEQFSEVKVSDGVGFFISTTRGDEKSTTKPLNLLLGPKKFVQIFA